MERYCTNCRALIPQRADRCENCGEIAGDLWDGKIRKPDRKRGSGFFLTLIALLAATAAYWWWQRQDRIVGGATAPALPSTRVVADRPGGSRRGEGASISEAQAIRLLQRQLVGEGRKRDCLMVSSQGYRDGAYRLTARDHCQQALLGRWKVDGLSGVIARE